MPEVERRTTVPLAAAEVWPHVADMNTWAPDIPGYRGHRTVSDRESVWLLTGDVGMLSREVEMEVLITEWREPTHVAFTLRGLEEPVSGAGSFSMEPASTAETALTFALALNAGGPLGPVINALLKPFLPRVADQFVEAMRARLLSRARST